MLVNFSTFFKKSIKPSGIKEQLTHFTEVTELGHHLINCHLYIGNGKKNDVKAPETWNLKGQQH